MMRKEDEKSTEMSSVNKRYFPRNKNQLSELFTKNDKDQVGFNQTQTIRVSMRF